MSHKGTNPTVARRCKQDTVGPVDAGMTEVMRMFELDPEFGPQFHGVEKHRLLNSAGRQMRESLRDLRGSQRVQELTEESLAHSSRVFANERLRQTPDNARRVLAQYRSGERDDRVKELALAAAVYLKCREISTAGHRRIAPTWSLVGAIVDLANLATYCGLHYEFEVRRAPARATAKRTRVKQDRIEELLKAIEAGKVRADPRSVVEFRGQELTNKNRELARKDLKAVEQLRSKTITASANSKK